MSATLGFREIRSVRDCVREFSSVIDLLRSGQLEKVGIVKGSSVVGVVLPFSDEDAYEEDDPRPSYTTRDIMRSMNGILASLRDGVDEVIITQYNLPRVRIVAPDVYEHGEALRTLDALDVHPHPAFVRAIERLHAETGSRDMLD